MKICAAVLAASAFTASAPAFAILGQANTGPGFSLASTCSGTTFGSGSTAGEAISGGVSSAGQSCQAQVSASVGGTAHAASATIAPKFSNSATSVATVGSFHLAAAETGSSESYFPGAQAMGGWNDMITLTGPAGQTGLWVFSVHVDGGLQVAGSYPAGATFSVTAFQNNFALSHSNSLAYNTFLAANGPLAPSSEHYYSYDQGENWAVERDLVDRVILIDEIVSFVVPFTYNTPFKLGIYGQAQAAEFSYGGLPAPMGTAAADFAHTIRWSGKGYVLGNGGSGPATTNFAVSALSGFNYSATAVPEPASWSLLIAGFGLVGTALRRRPARTAA